MSNFSRQFTTYDHITKRIKTIIAPECEIYTLKTPRPHIARQELHIHICVKAFIAAKIR